MTNYEKYKDQLMFILMDRIGVDRKKGTPKSCAEVGCKNCRFYIKDDRRCNHRVAKWLNAEWLNAEVQIKKEFTVEEKVFVSINDKIPYYVRDKKGRLCGCTEKPHKKDGEWRTDNSCRVTLVNEITSLPFFSIKWEDDEPTSRDEILNS